MMPFSYFAARLQCPACGTRVENANIVTGLYLDAGTILRVGDRVNVTLASLRNTHYTVRPVTGEPVHILEEWMCPHCGVGHVGHWTAITLAGNAVKSIELVGLTRQSLARANFISDAIAEVFEEITGEPLFVDDEFREGWVDLLSAKLEMNEE